MLLYCLKCRKNTGNENPKVARTKNGSIILLSKFIKQQETCILLSSLRIKTPLSKFF